jgi:hypothetical protein
VPSGSTARDPASVARPSLVKNEDPETEPEGTPTRRDR